MLVSDLTRANSMYVRTNIDSLHCLSLLFSLLFLISPSRYTRTNKHTRCLFCVSSVKTTPYFVPLIKKQSLGSVPSHTRAASSAFLSFRLYTDRRLVKILPYFVLGFTVDRPPQQEKRSLEAARPGAERTRAANSVPKNVPRRTAPAGDVRERISKRRGRTATIREKASRVAGESGGRRRCAQDDECFHFVFRTDGLVSWKQRRGGGGGG